MGLFRSLTAKPWLDNSVEELPAERRTPASSAKIGLGLFLAVVSALFLLLTSAYFGRMAYDDWQSLPEPSILRVNTLVLVLSSVALHWARLAARKGQLDELKIGLIAAGILAYGFLFGQLVAWRELNVLGYYVATNPANAFFYLITALHAAHLLGGLVAWGRTMSLLWSDGDTERLRLRLQLCSRYWDFLLVVWLLLYGLLLADNDGKISFLGFCRAIGIEY